MTYICKDFPDAPRMCWPPVPSQRRSTPDQLNICYIVAFNWYSKLNFKKPLQVFHYQHIIMKKLMHGTFQVIDLFSHTAKIQALKCFCNWRMPTGKLHNGNIQMILSMKKKCGSEKWRKKILAPEFWKNISWLTQIDHSLCNTPMSHAIILNLTSCLLWHICRINRIVVAEGQLLQLMFGYINILYNYHWTFATCRLKVNTHVSDTLLVFTVTFTFWKKKCPITVLASFDRQTTFFNIYILGRSCWYF